MCRSGGDHLVATSVCPSRSAHDERQTLAPTLGPVDVTDHLKMLVSRDLERVEGVDVPRQAVDDALALLLERAEQPVPDDEDASVVPVDVLGVAPVVNT